MVKIEYRDSKPLSFSGKAIGNVELLKGISDVDVEIVKYLITNDYFKSLVDSETVILREPLPEEDPVVVDKALIEDVAKETFSTTKKRKASIEFSEEAE